MKLSSLQKLTDIRANKPGVHLLHFVVQVSKLFICEFDYCKNSPNFRANVTCVGTSDVFDITRSIFICIFTGILDPPSQLFLQPH